MVLEYEVEHHSEVDLVRRVGFHAHICQLPGDLDVLRPDAERGA